MPKTSSTRLTDAAVANLKPKAQRFEVFDALLPGFGVRVSTARAKSWIVLGRQFGRKTRQTIGRYPAMSLKEARGRAQTVLRKMQEGSLTKPEHTPLFEEVVEEWYTREQRARRSFRQVEGAINLHVMPYLKGRPIDTITKSDLLRIIDRIADRGATTQANRVRAFCRRLFNWAAARDIIDVSPALSLPKAPQEASRERVLSLNELGRVWGACDALGYPFGPIVRLLILTGQRRDEVAGLRWSEVDLDASTWVLEGARAKNGATHVVHLCDEAVDILRQIPRRDGCAFVFTTTGARPVSGYSKAKARLDRLSGVVDWRLHDLRRTFATHATGELKAQPAVIDKALNHRSGAVRGVAAVYQRAEYADERRDVLNAWGSLVSKLYAGNNKNE